jgi:hypothetical protein
VSGELSCRRKVESDDREDDHDPKDEPKERDGARGKEAANVVIELGRLPSLLPVLAKCGYPWARGGGKGSTRVDGKAEDGGRAQS